MSAIDGRSAASIGVLIVDDQALVRAGFRMILEIEPDLHVVGEAADGDQAVAQVAVLGQMSCSWTCGCRESTGSRPRAGSWPTPRARHAW